MTFFYTTSVKCLAISLGLAFVLTVDAQAQKSLKIGVTSGSPPYILSIEEGKGIDPDILTVIAGRMGYRPVFMPVPFKRRSVILSEKKVDAVTFWTKPEGVTCYPGQPYRYWRNALFKVSRKEVPSMDAPMNRIGIFMGSEHLNEQLAAVGIDHTNLQRIFTIKAAVRMLLHERLDGYIGDYPTVIYNFKAQDKEAAFKAEIQHFFRPAPQRLCFATKELADTFDATLAAIIRDEPNILSDIANQHGLTERITPPLQD